MKLLTEISTVHYLALSLVLFAVGMTGVMVRRNILTILMSIELIFNAVNINLVAFSRQLGDLSGHVFAIFVITVAAGEAAIGLGILVALFRLKNSVLIDDVHEMNG